MKHQHDVDQPVDLSEGQNQVEHDEAMPGFYEHDEDDTEIDLDMDTNEYMDGDAHHSNEVNAGNARVSQSRSRPPVSAPSRTDHVRQKDMEPSRSGMTVKPLSTNNTVRPSIASSSNSYAVEHPLGAPPLKYSEVEARLECPICGKTLETDNQGLNSHVDFCLSRGAIMAAQTNAKRVGTDTTIAETRRKKR